MGLLMCVCVVVFVSGMTGLLAFLLIVLEWTRPSLPSPLRPICDLRVLNHFIKEAQDAEAAMVSVNVGKKNEGKKSCDANEFVPANVTTLTLFRRPVERDAPCQSPWSFPRQQWILTSGRRKT